MRRLSPVFLFMIFLQSTAAAQSVLIDGAYDVQITLELPSVADTNSRKQERLCLSHEHGPPFGLAVLSVNNPLGNCPISNARVVGGTMTFDVACPGVNAASGHASYAVGPDGFQGRIEMKMGGKNMTMTEVQSGRRVGDCETARTH